MSCYQYEKYAPIGFGRRRRQRYKVVLYSENDSSSDEPYPSNIQSKIPWKLPTIPAIPPPSTIKVIVGGQLSRTIWTEESTTVPKKLSKKTQSTSVGKKEPPIARSKKTSTTTQSATIVKRKPPVARSNKPSKTTKSMTNFGKEKTTGMTVLATHESSELHLMHDHPLLTKEPFGWELDLTLSEDTDDLDPKPPAKKTVLHTTTTYESPNIKSTTVEDLDHKPPAMMMSSHTTEKHVPSNIHIFHESSSVELEPMQLEIPMLVSGKRRSEFKFVY